MANNLISPVITNDPKQRPMVGVFSTIYNYVIVIVLSIIVSMVLLPQYGDNYTVDLLSKTAVLFVGLSAVFTVLAIIGVSPIDKPENFTILSYFMCRFLLSDDFYVLKLSFYTIGFTGTGLCFAV
jgi:phosphoglycerol transferase MdoB-like AlkP superfamily enzyme